MEKEAFEIERWEILTHQGERGASVEEETNIEKQREREGDRQTKLKRTGVLDRMSFSASVSPAVIKGQTSLGEINGKDLLDGE